MSLATNQPAGATSAARNADSRVIVDVATELTALLIWRGYSVRCLAASRISRPPKF